MHKNFDEIEADSWFDRNINSLEKVDRFEEMKLLSDWLYPFENEISNILEIGCGPGIRLNYLVDKLNAKGTGIDPSPKSVQFIRSKFPHISCKVGYSHSMSLQGQFDLVHLGFFMYLVDRESFYKTISEIDSAVKVGGFLSIIDFDPPYPYSNEYAHRKGSKSYKLDNSSVFVSSGLYTLINKYSYSTNRFCFTKSHDDRISLSLLYKNSL